jgi:hypothetical protein
MMQKVNKQHGKGDIYMAPKNDHEKQFGIRHFAGVVFYDSQGTVALVDLSFESALSLFLSSLKLIVIFSRH